MKLEAFVKVSLIVVTVLTAISFVYFNVYWEQNFSVEPAPSTSALNKSYDQLSVIRSQYENDTLLTYTKSGQVEETNADSDDNFILYQARAFEAAGKSATGANNIFALITSFGKEIQANAIISSSIIIFIVMSIGFAFITFWRGRRP